VFYGGRDDVHGVLVHLFTRVRLSVKMNMFGYDDDQLNQILDGLVQDPNVMVQVTLDRSQASGVHEKQILASDEANDPAGYAADFAVGESDTNQISHTKGGVLDGIVAFEGSTNWSSSGEGTGISLGEANKSRGSRRRTTPWPYTSTLMRSRSFPPGWTTNTASRPTNPSPPPRSHNRCPPTLLGSAGLAVALTQRRGACSHESTHRIGETDRTHCARRRSRLRATSPAGSDWPFRMRFTPPY